MKKPIFIATAVLAFCVSAFSQEKEFYYRSTETNGGSQVQLDNAPYVDATKASSNSTTIRRPSSKQFPPSPLTGDEYKRRVAVVTPESTPLVTQTALVAEARREFATPQDYNNNRIPTFKTETIRQPSEKFETRLRGLSTGSSLIDSYIVDSSRRYTVDPLLIYAQMGQESSFKLKALSNKGASGLMQLMPATARRLGVTNIYDPKQNIEGGVKYMRILLDMFAQDISLALAGYNAGEGAVIKYGYKIPPYKETQDYVRRISARYNKISGTAVPRYVYSQPEIEAESRPTVSLPPSGWESGADMLRRSGRPVIARN